MTPSLDTFKSRRTLTVGGAEYDYFSLPEAEKNGLAGISRLPFSLKVLLENLLRYEDGRTVTADDIRAMADLAGDADERPRDRLPPGARADAGFHRRARRWSTSPPCATPWSRSAATRQKINPLVPVDLVIDHSVMVDDFGNAARLRARTSSSNTSATASATSSCAGASRPSTISASCRRAPASATRSTSNISRRPCGPRRRTARPSPIPTRWSAPTATPPWSTASPCSAGASAASRRRPPCSASRSRC